MGVQNFSGFRVAKLVEGRNRNFRSCCLRLTKVLNPRRLRSSRGGSGIAPSKKNATKAVNFCGEKAGRSLYGAKTQLKRMEDRMQKKTATPCQNVNVVVWNILRFQGFVRMPWLNQDCALAHT